MALLLLLRQRLVLTMRDTLMIIAMSLLIISFYSYGYSYSYSQMQVQPPTADMITYSKQSNFIKEFNIPNNIQELGLKGITIDSDRNAWFYHTTNKTTKIIKFEPENENFTQYNVTGNTVVDNAIINLAGGQLIFDKERSIIWFTDARTNSIGKLDTGVGKIELVSIPTPNAGPMGITLSPDGKSIWFTEITGNKISSMDIESKKILEYPTGEESGPTLLDFDNAGILWVTQSYSNDILQVEPWMLVPNSNTSMGMSTITLPEPDRFSPFGIAIVDSKDNSPEKYKMLFASDHSSSRVVVSSTNTSNQISDILHTYTSYWTSPSKKYPATLPSQIVVDKSGNYIYFPQHGGNRISKIDIQSGIMTEYDIPTGPLSTAVFIAVSDDGKKVWFTEWASNKVAYLDTTIKIPLSFELENTRSAPIVLKPNQPPKTLDVQLNATEKGNNYSSSMVTPSPAVSLSEVELAVIGMTDLGLKGITYDAQPQRLNMEKNSTSESKIGLNIVQQGNRNNIPIRLNQYTTMIKASVPEKDQQFVSLLFPVTIRLDLPAVISSAQSEDNRQEGEQENQGWIEGFVGDLSLRNIVRVIAITAAVSLIGYIIYMRIKKHTKVRK
jgi:streptogramin lyase